jgi:two-component system, OmpR family, alkaline phosphatase synthesis response regulator PhoP
MSTVLLVDATEEMRPLAASLEGAGYAVASRALGEVLTGDDEETPDVLIFNLTSPDADATAVRALLRSESMPHGVAAIALVRQGQLAGLDFSVGCDDFIVYPATAEELAARVRRAIWTKSGIWSDNTLRADDLMMDLANYKVYVAGRPIDLTYKEYELLRFLATNRGKVFTREALLSRVWGYDFYGGARTVDVHIRRLRSKIEDRTHVFIETVRNVGYRFKA